MAQTYDASASKETVSRFIDEVLEEMAARSGTAQLDIPTGAE